MLATSTPTYSMQLQNPQTKLHLEKLLRNCHSLQCDRSIADIGGAAMQFSIIMLNTTLPSLSSILKIQSYARMLKSARSLPHSWVTASPDPQTPLLDSSKLRRPHRSWRVISAVLLALLIGLVLLVRHGPPLNTNLLQYLGQSPGTQGGEAIDAYIAKQIYEDRFSLVQIHHVRRVLTSSAASSSPLTIGTSTCCSF